MGKQASFWPNLIALLAAFAAVLQWSIPHGWMIAGDASGRVMLTPCPGTSPGLAALGDTHSSHEHAHHGNDAMSAHHGMDHGNGEGMPGTAEAMCDFAALGAPALLSDPPVLEAPPIEQTAFLQQPRETIPGRGLAAPPPPATGPPHLIA